MKNKFAVRLLVFIGILVLLNAGFGVAGVHEHIDILGSVVLTLVIAVIMMVVAGAVSSRRAAK